MGRPIPTPPLWRGFFWRSRFSLWITRKPVHLDIDLLPRDYYQIGFELEDTLIAAQPHDPPRGWDCEPPYRPELQTIGDPWVRHGSSLGLRVPASVLPGRSNILINPAHPEMPRLREIDRRRLPWPGRVIEFLEGLRNPDVPRKARRRRRRK